VPLKGKSKPKGKGQNYERIEIMQNNRNLEERLLGYGVRIMELNKSAQLRAMPSKSFATAKGQAKKENASA
jgi:hypothetical protein